MKEDQEPPTITSAMPDDFLSFRDIQFVKSAVQPTHYPPPSLPEIAIAGRSNVGKSSLLNSLFQRKSLVKVSGTPGRTQLLNFFTVDGQLGIVDLPGYGYAKVPDEIRRQWRPMIERYILRRDPLIAIVFLLDIRRLPSEEDISLWIWLQHLEKDIVPVLTKADKLSSQQQKKQAFLIADALDIPHQGVVITSAKDHKGRDRLRDILRAYAWQATLRLRAQEQAALDEADTSQEAEKPTTPNENDRQTSPEKEIPQWREDKNV